MFILIWGFKTYVSTLGVVNLACRNGHTAAHRLVRTTRKFTLFWIPLFPVRRRYYSVCTQCGEQVAWPKEEAEAMAAGAPAPGGAPGVAVGAGVGQFDPVAAPVDPFVPAPVAAPAPPAGWYPDPAGSPQQRWWDGKGWTEVVS